MKHKWHKEIKAWADGAEIEMWYRQYDGWGDVKDPTWLEGSKFRIKPQPKQPQYLYAYKKNNNEVELDVKFIKRNDLDDVYQYVGKIKLKVDDD